MQGRQTPLHRIARHVFRPLRGRSNHSPDRTQTDGGSDRNDDEQRPSDPVIRGVDGPATVDSDGRSEYEFTVHVDLPREIGENARMQATMLGADSDEEWIEDNLAAMIELNRVYYVDGEPLRD